MAQRTVETGGAPDLTKFPDWRLEAFARWCVKMMLEEEMQKQKGEGNGKDTDL